MSYGILGGQVPAVSVPRVSRVMRHPTHPFHLRTPPYCIQPFMLAPVLPSETMKKLMLQARVVSDPIKNPLIGWHKEYFFFYVKVRDIMEQTDFKEHANRSLLEEMFINPDLDVSQLKATFANPVNYASAVSQIPWGHYCNTLVVEKYFRDEGEAYGLAAGLVTDTGASGYGWMVAQVNQQRWTDSLVLDAEYVTPTDPGVVIGGDDTITMREWDAAHRAWMLERQFGFTQLTFEEYQRQQGVNIPDAGQQEGKPELIRYIKEWTYPANTVLSGSVNSALSWSIQEKADKDRFFREPGFIFGVTVARPKVYFSGQTSAMVNFLDRAVDWLPAALREDAYGAMKTFASGAGPLPGVSTAYWVDLRDLFMYGDQFVNFALTETNAGLVALPTAGAQKKYPSMSDINALFSTATVNKVREDGVVQLSILGTVRDHTART